jgi:phosphodiesterase/alkaline phosphatase D-like protein
MKRREFLRMSALGLVVPGCVSPEAPRELVCRAITVDPDADGAVSMSLDLDAIAVDDAAFPQGVMAGAMTSTAVTFWGRVVGERAAEPLRLKVWRDGDGVEGEVFVVSDERVQPVSDSDSGEPSGIVKVRLQGLRPSTVYRYGLFAVDEDDVVVARSSLGRVRTTLADDSCAPVVLGATTCTNPRNMPYTALAQLAEVDELGPLDAVLHLGDMVYADGSRSVDDYRAHWRSALADPGYRALLAQAGMLIAWDDHEFDNNLDVEQTPAGLIENAKKAFYENTPMERSEGDWTSHRFGLAVEVIRLDCRTARQASRRETDSAAYLSRPQMDFLKTRLKESPCHFKVVMNSVPMTKMPDLWVLQGDRWQGYEPAREEILDFLEENDLDNVWFLSGDFHVGFVARLETRGFRSRLWEVAVGPGGNAGNPIMAFVVGGQRDQVFPDDQFVYGEGRMAATRLVFDVKRDRVQIRFSAADGTRLFDKALSRHS